MELHLEVKTLITPRRTIANVDDKSEGDSLQMKSFSHQSLQARFVEDVVGELLVGEHGQGGALGSGGQL